MGAGNLLKQPIQLMALIFILTTTTVSGRVWYVAPDSGLTTIQAALDSCADYDTVMVASGLYQEHLIWPATHGIKLIHELSDSAAVIYNEDYYSPTILIATGVDTTTHIDGFTIKHGSSLPAQYPQAGIHCLNHSSPLITHDSIVENCAFGIVCADTSAPAIESNIIAYNINGTMSGATGGGIWIAENSAAIIRNNRIVRNGAGGDGNAVYAYGIYCANSPAQITGNTIAGNNASVYLGSCFAYGIFCQSCSPMINGNYLLGQWRHWDPQNETDGGHEIECVSASPRIEANVFQADTDYAVGVYCSNASDPLIHMNSIVIRGTSSYGVQNIAAPTINAEYNWWGDSTGPYHPSLNPGGLGSNVSDYVDFIPWNRLPVNETVNMPLSTSGRLLVRPNPGRDRIRFTVMADAAEEPVRLSIYDELGRRRYVIPPSSITNRGTILTIDWNCRDDAGVRVPAGCYIIRMETHRTAINRLFIVIR